MKKQIYYADLTPCDNMDDYKEAAFVPQFVLDDTKKFDTKPPIGVVQLATHLGWCIVAKWYNNGSTRIYGGTEDAIRAGVSILGGCCDSGDCGYAFGEEKIFPKKVSEKDVSVFDGYTTEILLRMEQKEEIKVQGTDETFATQATNSLKIEDLKNGDFVAFDYNGNTAVTRLTSDDGDFMYAVGLWHDSNLVGDVDAIWYADNLKDVNSVSPITNLHYVTIDEVKRYVNALTESFEIREQMQRESEPKMLPDCVTTEDYIKSLTNKLTLTLQAKNHDYNSAFSEMFDELGIDYAYGKLREKMNRIKVLRSKPNMVKNEGLEDALLDTAGYAILTLVELKKRKSNDTH